MTFKNNYWFRGKKRNQQSFLCPGSNVLQISKVFSKKPHLFHITQMWGKLTCQHRVQLYKLIMLLQGKLSPCTEPHIKEWNWQDPTGSNPLAEMKFVRSAWTDLHDKHNKYNIDRASRCCQFGWFKEKALNKTVQVNILCKSSKVGLLRAPHF